MLSSEGVLGGTTPYATNAPFQEVNPVAIVSENQNPKGPGRSECRGMMILEIDFLKIYWGKTI
jgi:hypothetical protein